MLVILSHCQSNILLIISLDILHIHTIPSNNRWVEQKQKTFQDQRICYFLYSAQFHWAVVVFKPCKTEQEKENDKPHGKGGLCGETLHFYIVVLPTLSVLASDRKAPWPAKTRLPICVYWCCMVVQPHSAVCISWCFDHIYQKCHLCCKGGHLLCHFYCIEMRPPCRLVVMRQLLSLT